MSRRRHKEIILYENGDFWIKKTAHGDYEVLRNVGTHAVIEGSVNRKDPRAFTRAKAIIAYLQGKEAGYIK